MILLGDCLEQMKTLKDNSVDAVVTDPPYGLAFMGKKWDYDVPSVDVWKEVFRVLKPGGHVLSFGGTRTYHRMVVNIEDAGFEIRDQVMWIYGSGFPKSLNISKAIDKTLGVESEQGVKNVSCRKQQVGPNGWVNAERPEYKTKATSNDAKQWDGWGSALKPANEPICLARKPLEKGLTLAENVLKWGTGGLNIDGSRIGTEKIKIHHAPKGTFAGAEGQTFQSPTYEAQGRWPANILFDEEAAAVLDEQSGILKPAGNKDQSSRFKKTSGGSFSNEYKNQVSLESNSGGASRFFYVAKASKRERNAGLEDFPDMRAGTERMNNSDGRKAELGEVDRLTITKNGHPTVKPVKLMEYLIALITPPHGSVLDPFTGSGSTGVAAKNLNREFIGCEMNEEYHAIAEKRIASV